MKTINVVIPAYNEEKNIKRCIDSVLSQELSEVSLFITVVDDCSSDNTKNIVKSLENKNLILISNERNLGRGGSINIGASMINSDLLYFIDADCYFSNNECIRNMLLELEKKKSDICIGDVFAAGNSFWDKYYNYSRSQKSSEEKWCSANLLIKKDIFFDVDGFDSAYEKYGFEDRDLIYTCFNKGRVVVFTNECKVYTFCDYNDDDVFDKMFTAGNSSASIFMSKFGDIYKKTNYYKIHYRNRKIDILFLIIARFKKIIRFLFELKWPFCIKSKIANLLLLIYYFEGTYCSKKAFFD